MTSNISFSRLWDELLSEGQVTTTQALVRERTGSSAGSVRLAIAGAQHRHLLFSPVRGLYVLVPPQYRRQGTVPADWFLDDMCRHLGRDYYLAYLSAAAHHGSGHHAAQVTQTVVDRRLADRSIGSMRLRFYSDSRMSQWPVATVTGPTGSLRVATPETCAFDLAESPARGGGVSNVVTVLRGLTLNAEKLADQAGRRPRATARRLGFLLDHGGIDANLGPLVEVATADHNRTLLDPTGPAEGSLDRRWHVVANTALEPDA